MEQICCWKNSLVDSTKLHTKSNNWTMNYWIYNLCWACLEKYSHWVLLNHCGVALFLDTCQRCFNFIILKVMSLWTCNKTWITCLDTFPWTVHMWFCRAPQDIRFDLGLMFWESKLVNLWQVKSLVWCENGLVRWNLYIFALIYNIIYSLVKSSKKTPNITVWHV